MSNIENPESVNHNNNPQVINTPSNFIKPPLQYNSTTEYNSNQQHQFIYQTLNYPYWNQQQQQQQQIIPNNNHTMPENVSMNQVPPESYQIGAPLTNQFQYQVYSAPTPSLSPQFYPQNYPITNNGQIPPPFYLTPNISGYIQPNQFIIQPQSMIQQQQPLHPPAQQMINLPLPQHAPLVQPQLPSLSLHQNNQFINTKSSKVPLYCGSCRVYGCQCFYGSNKPNQSGGSYAANTEQNNAPSSHTPPTMHAASISQNTQTTTSSLIASPNQKISIQVLSPVYGSNNNNNTNTAYLNSNVLILRPKSDESVQTQQEQQADFAESNKDSKNLSLNDSFDKKLNINESNETNNNNKQLNNAQNLGPLLPNHLSHLSQNNNNNNNHNNLQYIQQNPQLNQIQNILLQQQQMNNYLRSYQNHMNDNSNNNKPENMSLNHQQHNNINTHQKKELNNYQRSNKQNASHNSKQQQNSYHSPGRGLNNEQTYHYYNSSPHSPSQNNINPKKFPSNNNYYHNRVPNSPSSSYNHNHHQTPQNGHDQNFPLKEPRINNTNNFHSNNKGSNRFAAYENFYTNNNNNDQNHNGYRTNNRNNMNTSSTHTLSNASTPPLHNINNNNRNGSRSGSVNSQKNNNNNSNNNNNNFKFPQSQTLCRLGQKCRFKKENKCKYYHPSNGNNNNNQSNGSLKQNGQENIERDLKIKSSTPDLGAASSNNNNNSNGKELTAKSNQKLEIEQSNYKTTYIQDVEKS
jgi:hypothetical protein